MKLGTSSVALSFAILVCASCRQDMHDQPRYQPLEYSAFFVDGRASRPVPPGTVAWDQLDNTDEIHTGEMNGVFVTEIPLPLTRILLQRGQQRFDIYCAPCHGYLGDGDGMIARRGFLAPANLHNDRVRRASPGYLFQVITNGFGAMPEYETQVPPVDRWAIVAYLRALELSQHASLNDLPPEAAKRLSASQEAP